MKKSIAIFFLLTFIITTLTAQKETKAEKAALTCLDKELKKAEISSDYFVEVMDTLSVLSKGFDIGSFEKKFKEVDTIFYKTGLYENDQLKVSILKSCMLTKYNKVPSQSDTLSSYGKLLFYIAKMEENSKMISDIPVSMHSDILNLVVSEEDRNNKFYKVYSFILFQGVVHEFQKFARNRDKDMVKKGGHQIETMNIIDSDVEIETNEIVIADDTGSDEIRFNEEIAPITRQSDDIELSIVTFEEVEEEEEVYFIVEDMPRFKGKGLDEFKKYIVENLRYPAIAQENGIQGKVYVQFIVNKEGKVDDVLIVRGVDPSLDAEAVRVVKSSPSWEPGIQRGKTVDVRFTFPVYFVLQK